MWYALLEDMLEIFGITPSSRRIRTERSLCPLPLGRQLPLAWVESRSIGAASERRDATMHARRSS